MYIHVCGALQLCTKHCNFYETILLHLLGIYANTWKHRLHMPGNRPGTFLEHSCCLTLNTQQPNTSIAHSSFPWNDFVYTSCHTLPITLSTFCSLCLRYFTAKAGIPHSPGIVSPHHSIANSRDHRRGQNERLRQQP